MHTMDFSGQNLDFVISVDESATNENGENNVHIEKRIVDNG